MQEPKKVKTSRNGMLMKLRIPRGVGKKVAPYITTKGSKIHTTAVLKEAQHIVLVPIINWSGRDRLYSQSTTGRMQDALAIERNEDGLVGEIGKIFEMV